MVPKFSQVNMLQVEQVLGDDGRLGVSGWKRSDHKRNSEPRDSPLTLPRCWQNLGLGIKTVKSREGQTPRQKEQ